MRRVDQSLQAFRPAIACLDGVQRHSVIAPVSLTRKSGNRHDLDCRYAKVPQVIEFRNHAIEGSCRREGAYMKLVQHIIFERHSAPSFVAPGKRARIYDFGAAVHAFR